jgi:hypothetical protein
MQITTSIEQPFILINKMFPPPLPLIVEVKLPGTINVSLTLHKLSRGNSAAHKTILSDILTMELTYPCKLKKKKKIIVIFA